MFVLFQSLNRAYKRSDYISLDESLGTARFNPSIGLTSVPTKGQNDALVMQLMFQSLNRAYKRSDDGV